LIVVRRSRIFRRFVSIAVFRVCQGVFGAPVFNPWDQAAQRCRRIRVFESLTPQLEDFTIVTAVCATVRVLHLAERFRAHSLDDLPTGAAAYEDFNLSITSAPFTFPSVPSQGKAFFSSVLVMALLPKADPRLRLGVMI
jgi:hypothetical protein